MSDSQDAIVVKKRARRRLIGAVALVLFVVIVLPMVLDKEPKSLQNELSVQIPRQDAGAFKSSVLPAPALGSVTGKADVPTASPKADVPPVSAGSEPVAGAKPAAKMDPPPVPKAPVAAKSQAAPGSAPIAAAAPAVPPQPVSKAANDGSWVVLIGAFSNPDNVRQLQAKLSAAGVKSLTEVLKSAEGEKIRVRGGPFKTKAEAEKARDAMKAIGVDAGAVTSR